MKIFPHFAAKRRKGEDKRTEEQSKEETEQQEKEVTNTDREYRLAIEKNRGIDEDYCTRDYRCHTFVYDHFFRYIHHIILKSVLKHLKKVKIYNF
jgi:hypothetical protein